MTKLKYRQLFHLSIIQKYILLFILIALLYSIWCYLITGKNSNSKSEWHDSELRKGSLNYPKILGHSSYTQIKPIGLEIMEQSRLLFYLQNPHYACHFNIKISKFTLCTGEEDNVQPLGAESRIVTIRSFRNKTSDTDFEETILHKFGAKVFIIIPQRSVGISVNYQQFNLDKNDHLIPIENNYSLKELFKTATDVLKLELESSRYDLLNQIIQQKLLRNVVQLILIVKIDGYSTDDDLTYKWYRLFYELFFLANMRLHQARITIADGTECQQDLTDCYIRSSWISHLKTSAMLKVPPAGMGTKSEEISRLIEYVTNEHVYCQEIQGMGGVKMGSPLLPFTDGAWRVCFDHFNRKSCLVYSIGINDEWSFDEAMEKQNCEVHSFDPTMNKKDHQHSANIYFYNIGIGDENKEKEKESTELILTLSSIIQHLKHEFRQVDVLKMDIEGGEWSTLTDIIKKDTLKQVNQLTFEIHLGCNVNTSEVKNAMSVLYMLQLQGFYLFHHHRNPIGLNLELPNTDIKYCQPRQFIGYELAFIKV